MCEFSFDTANSETFDTLTLLENNIHIETKIEPTLQAMLLEMMSKMKWNCLKFKLLTRGNIFSYGNMDKLLVREGLNVPSG